MTREGRVGLIVAAGLAVLVASVMFIGKVRVGLAGYPLVVHWKFVNDLKPDAPVKYAGGPVIGRVTGITVGEDELVVVKLWIDKRVRLREDCEFWIFTAGMLGEEYVEINASASGTAPVIASGAVIRGIDPVSIDATIIRMGKLMDALAPVFAKEEVAASVHTMVQNLDRVSRKIASVVDRHTKGVDAALTDLEAFSGSMKKLSGDFEAVMANAKALTAADNPDSIRAAAVKLNVAMDSLKAAAKTADGLAKKVDEGKGLLSTMIHDEELAKNFTKLIKNLADKGITAKVKWF